MLETIVEDVVAAAVVEVSEAIEVLAGVVEVEDVTLDVEEADLLEEVEEEPVEAAEPVVVVVVLPETEGSSPEITPTPLEP